MTSKQILRGKLLRRLSRQTEAQRRAQSQIILRRLRWLAAYRRAKTILCYVAIGGEVETRPFLTRALADGKRVAVPVVIGNGHRMVAAEIRDTERDLARKSRFGVPVPGNPIRRRIPVDRLDLVVVPGVGFDRNGLRLGRGGGHFDRFLGRLPARIPRVGLAFGFQIVPQLPSKPHDRPVTLLVTDEPA